MVDTFARWTSTSGVVVVVGEIGRMKNCLPLEILYYMTYILLVMSKYYALLEGRHPLPNVEGAVYDGFDFKEFKPILSKHFSPALECLSKGEDVYLYVTGLTPCLTHFLGYAVAERDNCFGAMGSLYLLHYNRDTEEYVSVYFGV